jgi:hypothetical protein
MSNLCAIGLENPSDHCVHHTRVGGKVSLLQNLSINKTNMISVRDKAENELCWCWAGGSGRPCPSLPRTFPRLQSAVDFPILEEITEGLRAPPDPPSTLCYNLFTVPTCISSEVNWMLSTITLTRSLRRFLDKIASNGDDLGAFVIFEERITKTKIILE